MQYKYFIVKPTNQNEFTVSLEGTSLFLTIMVSASILLGIGLKLISNFHHITSELRDLREDLNTHSNTEGHLKILEQVGELQDKLIDFDKRFAVHAQDYVNYKDSELLRFNGTREAIAHKWQRTEHELDAIRASVKELQHFLQKRDEFKIRE